MTHRVTLSVTRTLHCHMCNIEQVTCVCQPKQADHMDANMANMSWFLAHCVTCLVCSGHGLISAA